MAQVVAAAADPRWSWRMNSAFVAHAQRVRLTAPVPGLRSGGAGKPALLTARRPVLATSPRNIWLRPEGGFRPDLSHNLQS